MIKTNIIFDIETTGLMDNLFERVICICVHNLENKETKSFLGENEVDILNEFYSYIKDLNSPILIGYNSDGFDVPFIIRRAVVHKIKVPKFNTIDLRKVANGFRYSYNRMERGKLRDWALILGLPADTANGSEMFKLYNEKKFEEINNHCLEDLEITKKLYENVEACGLL